jgi:hypothetical protein
LNKLIKRIERLLKASDVPYFERHYLTVLGDVLQKYRAFFNATEQHQLAHYLDLGNHPRALYLRLAQRQGTWFLPQHCVYEEADPAPAINALIAARIVVLKKPDRAAIDELYNRFNKRMLGAILGPKHIANAKKEALWDLFTADFKTLKKRLPQWLLFTHQPLYDKVLLLFFGNRQQQLNEFVVEELAHRRYLPDALAYGKRWQTQDTFDAYARALRLRETAALMVEAKAHHAFNRLANSVLRQLQKMPPSADIPRHTARYQYLRIMLLYSDIHRRHFPATYERLLAKLAKLHWPLSLLTDILEKRLILAKKQKRIKLVQALNQVLQTQLKPFSYREQELAAKTDAWLSHKRRPTAEISTRELALPFAGVANNRPLYRIGSETCTVETAVLKAYAARGYQGVHSENFVPRFLGIMLFRDEIYNLCPETFYNHFQVAPDDFYSKSFYQKRAGEIDEKINAYRANPDSVAEAIGRNYADLQRIALPGLFLTGAEQSVVSALLAMLSPAQLLAIGTHYIIHPRRHGVGFPDLVLFNKDAMLIAEVKSPGDQLSVGQRTWLEVLKTAGIDFFVIQVKNVDI